MEITKRDGSTVPLSMDRIHKRIKDQSNGLKVDHLKIAIEVVQGLFDGVTSTQIDEQSARIAAQYTLEHHDYSLLAARLSISRMQKQMPETFEASFKEMKKADMLNKDYVKLVQSYNFEEIETAIKYNRDFIFNYFGYKTFERTYMAGLPNNGAKLERPQHTYMRIALTVTDSLVEAIRVYDLISKHYYTHATPTKSNAGLINQQLSSCYLLHNAGDDLDSIMETLSDAAKISAKGGGIGLAINNVRAKGTLIKGNGGESDGWLPYLRTSAELQKWWKQNGSKRKGSFAFYGEPWHKDIKMFLDIRKATGKEEFRARDIFTAIWMNDLFMQRVKDDADWTLFCPHEVYKKTGKYLWDIHGDEFKVVYELAESMQGLGLTIRARELWGKILESQLETGTPYMVYKDVANRTSNQKNLGTIKSSNLCVTFDSKILTESGYVDFCDLYFGKIITDKAKMLNQKIININGLAKSTEVVMTSDNAEIFEITLHNGLKLKSTAQHKYLTPHGLLPLNELTIGNEIKFFDGSVNSFGNINAINYALMAGLVIGDGSISNTKDGKQKASLRFWNTDIEIFNKIIPRMLKELRLNHPSVYYKHNPTYNSQPRKIKGFDYLRTEYNSQVLGELLKQDGIVVGNKHKIPLSIWRSDKKTVSAFIQGLFSTDGYVNCNKTSKACSVRLSSNHTTLLEGVQLLLLQFGINSHILKRKDASVIDRNDGKGGMKAYNHKATFELAISKRSNIDKFHVSIGFTQKHKNSKIIDYLTSFKGSNNSIENYQTKIKSIKTLGIEPVYCVKELKNNMVCLNGMHTGNCAEIIEYTSAEEIAVCNLASIALPKFVKIVESKPIFDFDHLMTVTKIATRAANRVIDVNHYPVSKTKASNLKHRPIGLGVQGLADVFALMKFAFDSPEAKALNKQIFEAIYYAAVSESNELARQYGPYDSIEGSPISQGIFNFEMYNVDPAELNYAWDNLRDKVKKYGIRNSLMIALMPTATTSQVMDNNECFEPFSSNMYTRTVLNGNFNVINKHLMRDLEELNLWTASVRNEIMRNRGSVQNIKSIPEEIRSRYKIANELSQKTIMDLAADRQPFVDQSQSMNIFMADPTIGKLNTMHFYGWEKGLKTGMYYLRSQAAANPNAKLGIDFNKESKADDKLIVKEESGNTAEQISCSIDDPEGCAACGS